MINDDMHDTFEKFKKDYLKFDRIANPPSRRPDLCAFLKLDAMIPSDDAIVACGEHDQIWLGADMDRFQQIATEDDILYLVRCGVMYDEGTDSLSMFV